MNTAKIFAIVMGSLICSSVLAEQIRYADGRTIDGRISRVEPDGVSVVHSSGITKVFFSEMPAEDQGRYGYDPQAAAAHQRRKIAESKLAVANARYYQAHAEAIEKIRETGFTLSGKVHQRLDNGILVINAYREDISTVEVSTSGFRPMESNRRFGEKQVLTSVAGSEPVYIICNPQGIVDGSTWGGSVYPAGTFQYDAVAGYEKTVRKFAATPEAALRELMAE